MPCQEWELGTALGLQGITGRALHEAEALVGVGGSGEPASLETAIGAGAGGWLGDALGLWEKARWCSAPELGSQVEREVRGCPGTEEECHLFSSKTPQRVALAPCGAWEALREEPRCRRTHRPQKPVLTLKPLDTP